MPPGINRLESTIVFAGFLGTMNRCQVAVSDAAVQAYHGALSAHAVGDRVAAGFPADGTGVLGH